MRHLVITVFCVSHLQMQTEHTAQQYQHMYASSECIDGWCYEFNIYCLFTNAVRAWLMFPVLVPNCVKHGGSEIAKKNIHQLLNWTCWIPGSCLGVLLCSMMRLVLAQVEFTSFSIANIFDGPRAVFKKFSGWWSTSCLIALKIWKRYNAPCTWK